MNSTVLEDPKDGKTKTHRTSQQQQQQSRKSLDPAHRQQWPRDNSGRLRGTARFRFDWRALDRKAPPVADLLTILKACPRKMAGVA